MIDQHLANSHENVVKVVWNFEISQIPQLSRHNWIVSLHEENNKKKHDVGSTTSNSRK